MKKTILSILGAVVLAGHAMKVSAQVKDVSFTVSPTVSYQWWDNNLNLGNTPFWGFRVGFGFGPIFELRGTFEKSLNLKSKLKDSGWAPLKKLGDKIDETSVDVMRLGGEMKVNLWPGTIVTPYITAGAGSMVFKYRNLPDGNNDLKEFKDGQLYGTLGAGAKINLSKRVVLALEARDLMFKPGEAKPYLKPNVKTDKIMQNWSASAGLDIYLGGHERYAQDEVSKAYREFFADGFKGMKFVLEPSIAYIDFNNKSAFRDQVFEGGSVGVDFNSLIGLRGFYYQATKDPEKPSFDFNKDLKMYGGNLIARLNFPIGVVPYLSLGAGYLDVDSKNYTPNDGFLEAKSGWFAMGGAGIEIPFSRYISIFGTVNAIMTKELNDPANVLSPSDVRLSTMYQSGLRFNIGNPSKRGDKVYQGLRDRALKQQHLADMDQLNQLRADYDARLKNLNQQLAEAVNRRDTVTVTKLVVEKQNVEKDYQEQSANIQKQVETEKTQVEAKSAEASAPLVTLTKSQFEDIVAKVVTQLDKKQEVSQKKATTTQPMSSWTDLDKILLINALYHSQYGAPVMTPQQMMSTQVMPRQQLQQQPQQEENNATEANKLLEKINQTLDKMNRTLDQQRVQQGIVPQQIQQPALVQPQQVVTTVPTVVETGGKTDPIAATKAVNRTSFLKLDRVSLLTGINFGQNVNWNLGVRTYMQISNTKLDFVPELYVGFGKKVGFGLSANVVYNFEYEKLPVTPYAGLGLGIFNSGNGAKFAPNVILGASLKNFLGGGLFVDYSVRGLFSNNQIAVGYRFIF